MKCRWCDRVAWLFLATVTALIIAAVLSGCTSTGYSRPPGVYVGPYDITLSSHREALGLKP